MKSVLIIVLTLGIISACSQDKETLPGAYRLDKPKESAENIVRLKALNRPPGNMSLSMTFGNTQKDDSSVELRAHLKKTEGAKPTVIFNLKFEDGEAVNELIFSGVNKPRTFLYVLGTTLVRFSATCKDEACKDVFLNAEAVSQEKPMSGSFITSFFRLQTAETDFKFVSMGYIRELLTWDVYSSRGPE